jgi:hypothetical protein
MTLGRCGGFLAKALLTIYIASAALLPLSHHDIVCHLKSPNHCTTCLTTGSGEAAPDAASLDVWTMADVGRATTIERDPVQSAYVSSACGRAPPAHS